MRSPKAVRMEHVNKEYLAIYIELLSGILFMWGFKLKLWINEIMHYMNMCRMRCKDKRINAQTFWIQHKSHSNENCILCMIVRPHGLVVGNLILNIPSGMRINKSPGISCRIYPFAKTQPNLFAQWNGSEYILFSINMHWNNPLNMCNVLKNGRIHLFRCKMLFSTC